MRTNQADLVVAAQAGDRRALDELLTAYLPLVYNVVGRALSGYPDVDDVVQETMLRAVRELPALRSPESFRSWLVAIAMRQISTQLQRHETVARRTAALDEAARLPAADFEDLAILSLGLSGQRRQLARASRWLDPDDRALLSLWWLETAGQLTRAELAAALDVTVAHVGVRVQRMRQQLDLSRGLVAALDARPRCRNLESVVAGWDGRPGPLWRKRVARHTRSCPVCARAATDLIPADLLLVGVALVPVPLALTTALLPKTAEPVLTAAGTTATTALTAGVGKAPTGAGVKAGLLGKVAASVGAHAVALAVAAGTLAGAVVIATTWPSAPSRPRTTVTAPRVVAPSRPPQSAPSTAGVQAIPLGPVSLESGNRAGRFVTYVGDVGVLAPLAAGDPVVDRQRASFDVVPGLADPSCITLRFRDGRFVRHASWQLRLGVNVGTVLFIRDATFCPRAGTVSGSVVLESYNYPGWFLRHRGDVLWVDQSDGSAAFRADSSFWVRPAMG